MSKRKNRKNIDPKVVLALQKHGEEVLYAEDPEETNKNVYAQIAGMLESGLHPSYLTGEEKKFLNDYIGGKWYERFGYSEVDTFGLNI